ncbi:MAG: 2-hydroxychromene-2-carboxylate isomerase [Myxococcota bacterium]|nr:2-hydroxychromene-2-carboxylate isomerase [Myxococcota bacterium]
MTDSETAPERRVDFYWDIGSTNSYFAFRLLPAVLERTGAMVVMHPFNLGYVFRLHNYALTDEPRAKMANRKRDLMRWAERYELPFRMPDGFPIKTSRALRGAIAMREWGLEAEYMDAIFSAYWERNDASIADYPGLRPLVETLGIDGAEFEARSESAACKQALIDSTNAGLERGVFGAPTFVVGNEIFWGKDRLDFVEYELTR